MTMKTDWNRRDFLKNVSGATLATMAAGAPLTQLLTSCNPRNINSKADTVILLWMAGGMAHTETFDPKAYTPFTTGMEANSVLSTFKSLPTVVDGVSFSEGLQSIGSIMDRGTV